MQECGCHEHHIGCEEIGTCKDYHDETDREHECTSCADETWSVCLIPRSRFGGEKNGTTVKDMLVGKKIEFGRKDALPESEKWPCHESVPEQLVESHVGLLGAYPAYQFNGLLSRKCIHLWGLRS